MSRTARVTFNYVAEQEDELSLEVGAIIRNIKDVDTGWCQGELNGKTGLFPNNFVEEVDITPDVVPASDSVAGKEAKVTFDYESQDQDELTLKLGDIVHVLGEEEPGWWRGQLGGKTGVFPSNFVEIITDNNVAKPKDTPLDTARKLSGETSPLEKKTTRNEVVDGLHVNDDEESGIKRGSSFGAAAKKLPGGGMGFGNLINHNNFILAEKKLKKLHQHEKRENIGKTEEAFVPTTEPSKPSLVKTKTPVSSKARSAPPVPLTSPVSRTDTNFERQRDLLQHKGRMEACLVEQLQQKELQQEIGRTQLQEKEEQTREKENDKANLQRQLEVLQQQLREKEQCLDNYQAQLEERNLRETNLIQQLQEKELQRQNCQRQLQEMEEQIREKEDNKANSERQLREMAQSFEARMGEKEEEKTNLETQLRMKNQELSELVKSLSAAQKRIIELRQDSCDWVISRDEIQVKDKCLGKGGWGNVSEATYCGCKVAVKQIHELILSPHNRRLFEREMYIASRCRHPCLLQFIGATNDEGSPLFVTELMELSLRALLEQRQLTKTQISVISLDISRALNYLHHMKPSPIVHRDVSSANVLLWRRGEQWRGKVSDYGTAKFVQQNMTVAPGALIYSAPEAVSSNQTSKVDVYSFGVLLCEMYIREMPDPERREEQVLLVRNRFFRNLVRQCLQADPATRPDMAQIIQQLEQFDGTDDRLN